MPDRDDRADVGLEATLAVGTEPGLDATLAATTPAAPVLPAKPVALDETVASIDGAPASTPPSVRARRQTGRTLGRFTLVDKLGAGAMGIVYRADDPELGRSVALKLLHRPDNDLTQRLVREARAMAQVSHPNVVTIYDVGIADTTTYIAMELVEGTSLREWQKSRHEVPEIIEHYLAAGRGLAAAHAAGLIHRDFKPDNVLVGTDGRVRVSDFGLAAPHDGGDAAASMTAAKLAPTNVALTTTGMFLGTPTYMAPEQFELGHVDSRTDQFAFCVALYEALYGQRPFAGKTFLELGEHVSSGRLAPTPAGTRISSALRAIVLRGLSVKPGDRYPSMDLLLADLGRDRARPWRNVVYAGAAVAAALAIGLVADLAAESRLDTETRHAFITTGKQTLLAMDLLAGQFRASSDVAYVAPWIREVSATHDNADFGFGDNPDGAAPAVDLHETLQSADLHGWTTGMREDRVEAFADRSGQLVYTTADVTLATGDLAQLPAVHTLISQSQNASTMQILPNDQPVLAQTHVLGPKVDPKGVSVMFARAIAPGGAIGAVYLQFAAGAVLLEHISTDDEVKLALVSPDGRYTPADFPAALAAIAPGGIAQPTVDGTRYRVQSIAILDEQGAAIGRVVMARKFESLLSGLFPHARTIFLLAMLGVLGIVAFGIQRVRTLQR